MVSKIQRSEILNLVGKKIEYGTCISVIDIKPEPTKINIIVVFECGHELKVRAHKFMNGLYKDCSLCRSNQKRIKHGNSRSTQKKETSEYKTWCAIKNRCYNKKSTDYNYYGGRGIVMCEEWVNDFSVFLKDMGNRPSDKHSIDRIDVNGNYEPSNCRWASRKEQANNTRRSKLYKYNTYSMTKSQWSEFLNIKRTTFSDYVLRNSFEKAIIHFNFKEKMIDFKFTSQTEDGQIEFVNDKGETVRTYLLSELEQFVNDNYLNLSYGHEASGGTGMVCDPNTDFKDIEVLTPVTEWLDEQDNFVSACEMFYKHKNPHEFKSFNREQETIRRVG